uniref:MBF2 n=1 Tax=Samia cynthia TaxID=7127 RepID=O96054_SAMCY|nr:MBF2 [Samia cynthia]
MKLLLLVSLITFIVIVDCTHTFLGTSVLRPLIYHHDVQYSSKIFKKRVENLYFSLPSVPTNYGRTIQGILAYDKTNSGASANVTQGGLGYNFMNLRMKSDRGREIHYDVYVYA